MDKKENLKLLLVPIGILVVFAVFVFGYKLLGLPDKSEVIAAAERYYVQYGYATVFVGALVEGLLFLNWYLPGSIVAVLGVVFAKENNLNVYLMIGLITLAFFTTSLINYALGRFGWYRLFLKFGLGQPLETIKSKVEKRGLLIIFSTYIHPNLGALTATSAGILKLDFRQFFLYSLLATAFWNSVWGLVVYYSGPFILNFIGPWLFGGFLLIWVTVSAVKYIRHRSSHVNIP